MQRNDFILLFPTRLLILKSPYFLSVTVLCSIQVSTSCNIVGVFVH